MKKLIIITSLLVITASCINKEKETVKEHAPSLYCFTEKSASTKTVLSVDTEGIGTIFWNPADSISVFFGTEKLKYYSTNEKNVTNVIFDTNEEIDGANADFSNIWGLYPYNADATGDGLSVTTTIPASQQCIDKSFDIGLFPMLAHSASNELHFKNICGGIKFSLSRDDIRKITFNGNNDEDVAGRVRVKMDEDGKPIASIESGEKMITLTPKEGDSFKSGTNYYIVILPCSLTDGFTVTFETNDEMGSFIYNEKTISIKRSVFSKIENIDSYASYRVLIPDGVVDMGLSVMWATCNIGAATPEENGDYYAWGETETKAEYTWATYKWCEGTSTSYTKYNSNQYYGIVDNKNTLDLEDDVAYVKLGGRWRMPSAPEIEELNSNCTVTHIQSNGVEGWQYTSKKNGNSIFIPMSGRCGGNEYAYVGYSTYLWSSYKALCLYNASTTKISPYLGAPVRPVFNSGEDYETPDNPTDGIIDLGLSVKWRSRNLGAEFPEESGGYFQWAGTRDVSDTSIKLSEDLFPYGHSETTYGVHPYLNKYNDGDHNGKIDNKRQLDAQDDAATVILGETWHTPTSSEFRELIQNCSWTRICINGVGGYKIQSNVPGFTDKWIFLPVVGTRFGNSIEDRICKYWSSTLSGDSYNAMVLWNNTLNKEIRPYGLPIRPVTSSSD